jgi:hypothetical protein
MGLTKALYRHDYRVNERAKELLIKSIEEARVNVHEPYDLFKVTDVLEFHCTQFMLERYQIGTTMEVMKAIEYLKDTNQI